MGLVVSDIQARNKDGKLLDALVVRPRGSRLYEFADYTNIKVFTNEGIFDYDVLPGLVTNFRSGGLFVDPFVDQIGDSVQIQCCWVPHDLNYTPNFYLEGRHPVSRKLADELLKASLVFAGMGKIKANAVYYSVRAFGGSAYEEDDHLTVSNSKLFKFSW